MNRKVIVGVVLLAGSAAFGAWQTLRIQDLQAQLDALQSSHDRWSQENQQQADQYNKTIAGLKQQVQDKESQLETVTARATVPAAGNQAPLVANTRTTTQPATANNPRPSPMDSPDFRQAMVQQQVMSRFGAFIVGLKLSPEKEKELKNRLATAMMKGQELSRELSKKVESGELTREESAAQWKASDVNNEPIRIMSEYLSGEQMDALRAYEADAPNRAKAMVANSMYMNLESGAPGLTEANRTKIAAAYAEAMLNPPKLKPGQPQPSAVDRTDQIYQQVETSLQETLSDDQMRIAREYLRNQASMQRAVQSTNASRK